MCFPLSIESDFLDSRQAACGQCSQTPGPLAQKVSIQLSLGLAFIKPFRKVDLNEEKQAFVRQVDCVNVLM